MLAVFFGLQTFAKDKKNTHIRIRCDNTAAVNINNMGTSHSDECNKLAKTIWEWCISKSIWISLAHVFRANKILWQILNYEGTKGNENRC